MRYQGKSDLESSAPKRVGTTIPIAVGNRHPIRPVANDSQVLSESVDRPSVASSVLKGKE